MPDLIEYPDVEQGTDAWLDLRRGMVTASTVGKLLTPTLKVASNDTSRGLVATLVAERLTGVVEPTFMSADMERGVELEPVARDYYAKHYAPVREIGFMARGALGYSPDGLVGDNGLIEIKCPRAKGHMTTVLMDQVPERYMAQLQAGLLVSGREWIDYVSFHAGMPLYVKRVTPEPAWLTAIADAVAAFEEYAEQLTSDYLSAAEGLHPTEPIDYGMEMVI